MFRFPDTDMLDVTVSLPERIMLPVRKRDDPLNVKLGLAVNIPDPLY